MTTDTISPAVRDAAEAGWQFLALWTAKALREMGESARDLGGNLGVKVDGDWVTVTRPDGSRILSIPLETLYLAVAEDDGR